VPGHRRRKWDWLKAVAVATSLATMAAMMGTGFYALAGKYFVTTDQAKAEHQVLTTKAASKMQHDAMRESILRNEDSLRDVIKELKSHNERIHETQIQILRAIQGR
jgi:hypothetical protein